MWTEKNSKLYREFEFRDFVDAWGFLSKVALLSEKANHHPEIQCTYNKVTIILFSHEEGQITSKDRKLAEEIERLLK